MKRANFLPLINVDVKHKIRKKKKLILVELWVQSQDYDSQDFKVFYSVHMTIRMIIATILKTFQASRYRFHATVRMGTRQTFS